MTQFRLSPRGPYSLAASASFLCGFTPGKGGSTTLEDGRLVLGFLDDARHVPVSVALAQPDGVDGDVIADIEGAPSGVERASIANQVSRILSLDHDARGLSGVGERDPIVKDLLTTVPGFRPVCFPSPYEAAVWAVLAQRISMAVASGIKRRLAIATDTIARGFGREFHPAPAPEKLLALRSFDGLPAEKLVRLQAVAVAALEGKLDAARLRAMPFADAVAELRTIRGVGPWTAEHVAMRGCGVVDEMPSTEPRVLRGIAETYGLDATPTQEEALHIAERWRPYRMWISVLMVMRLAGTARWHGPEPRGKITSASQRARAARSARAARPSDRHPSVRP